MDFGDILENWEENCKKSPEKAAGGRQNESGQAWRNKKTGPQIRPQHQTESAGHTADDVLDGTYGDKKLASVNPMDVWLRRYGVTDKDAAAESYEQKRLQNDREQIRALRPEAQVDLHGMTRDEAWTRLELFIAECCRRKLRKVLIIHGKGNHSAENSVLDTMVRTFIENDARLGASGHPDKRYGGRGATWVIIRDPARDARPTRGSPDAAYSETE